MKFLYTLIITILSLPAFSQSGNIQGTIVTTDAQAIEKATVVLLNTNYGSVTDGQGRFGIHKLAGGDYTPSAFRPLAMQPS